MFFSDIRSLSLEIKFNGFADSRPAKVTELVLINRMQEKDMSICVSCPRPDSDSSVSEYSSYDEESEYGW